MAWALVVIEGLQARCSVIASDAVGCLADYSTLPQVKSFSLGSSPGLAKSLLELFDVTMDLICQSFTFPIFALQAIVQVTSRTAIVPRCLA